MDNKNREQNLDDLSLPKASSSDLKGKQSVRATFKLSSRAIDALSIVAVHLGIKQKSLFDHLIEDIQALEQIAQGIQSRTFRTSQRVQKTYVLSRRTLSSLEETAKQYDTPRDALVEVSIQRLLPIIRRERDRHRKRKKVLQRFQEYVSEGQKLLAETHALLGDDDVVYEKLNATFSANTSACKQLEEYVARGDIIEDFEIR
jgi:hypothetical protein